MMKFALAFLFGVLSCVLAASVNVNADGSVGESSYTLRYFNARGRGEVIRTLFAASGTEYTDIRYNDRSEFEADRDTGIFPYHQVPVLEVDGVQIAQSHAAERFLASRFDLLGDNDVETALIDGVGEHIVDIMQKYISIKYARDKTDEEKEVAFDEFFGEFLPKQLAKLEVIANQNSGSDFIIGDEMSLADIQINVAVESLADNAEKALSDCPKLVSISRNVASQPGIAEWKATRPEEGPAKPVYKLRYFDARGRAEVIRHLFAYADVDYEDLRYSDPERRDLQADKDSGRLPYLQVPVLEVDGEPVAQSRAVERFLARRFGLLGDEDNDLETTKIEGVGEHIVDLYNKFSAIKYNREIDDDEKAKRWDDYYENYLPPQFEKLENIAAANEGSDYIVGDELTLADIQINVYLDSLRDLKCIEGKPNIQKSHEVVANTDGIKQWKAERPQNQ